MDSRLLGLGGPRILLGSGVLGARRPQPTSCGRRPIGHGTTATYDFYPGYWGPTVGFYGGIDYGFGYTGVGYQGGYWRNNQFYYNTAVNNLAGVHIANTYSQAVPAAANHVSFNGGSGGTTVKATEAQIAARAHTRPPTAEQIQHQQMAGREPGLRFNANHGQPPTMAMRRANEFHGARRRRRPPIGTDGRRRPARASRATMPRTSRNTPTPPDANFAYHAGGDAWACRARAFRLPCPGDARANGAAFHSCVTDAYGRRCASAGLRTSAACIWAAAPRISAASHMGGGAPHFGGMHMGGAAFRGTHMGAALRRNAHGRRPAFRRRPARRRRSARRPPRPVIGLPAPVIAAGAGVGRSSPRRSDDAAGRRPIRRWRDRDAGRAPSGDSAASNALTDRPPRVPIWCAPGRIRAPTCPPASAKTT